MNYIGSKLSLLNFLDESILQVTGQTQENLTFTDLFAGTGIVGRFFKRKGCQVIANDLQYYSYVLNRHYITTNTFLSFKGLANEIKALRDSRNEEEKGAIVCRYLDRIEPVQGFIYQNYCKGFHTEEEIYRFYFTDENGAKCDAIRLKIEDWYQKKMIIDDEYFFLLATLIEAIDKVANTASVYGAFLKKMKSSAKKMLRMDPIDTIVSKQDNKTYLCEANQLLSQIKTDILYLDPPYNERQYAANYHLLETIAKYDNPVLFGKTGIRDYKSQKSAFCSRNAVLDAFTYLIKNVKAKYIFLSYNNEGLLSFKDIKRVMSQRGQYGYFEKAYGRFKADQASEKRKIKANSTTEYLHYVITKE